MHKNMIITYPNGHTDADLDALVEKYLYQNPVIRHNKCYFEYNRNKGIWIASDIDEIKLKASKYFKRITQHEWWSKYERNLEVKLKVAIEDVNEMSSPENYICLKNGVLDIVNGALMKFDMNYYFTSSFPVIYDEHAKCPKFLRFLKQITCNKKDRWYSLAEFMGLSLTKEKGSDRALVLLGSGQNGKSVFRRILCGLLGSDNYTSITLKELSNFGTGNLEGKHLVIMDEASKKTLSNLMTDEMKQLVSGEDMEGRTKYIQNRTIRPFAKVLLLTNHRLSFVDDSTEGALRRLLIIPFEYHVPDKERDIELEKKLLSEKSGILNLAIQGYQRLMENNYIFSCKPESDRIIKEMLMNENPMGSFIRERIENSNGSHITYSEFKKEYKKWCEKKDIHVGIMDSKEIYNEVREHFNIIRWRSDSKRGMKNISWKQK